MMALRTAATGMAAQDLNVDVISNNIANMNTVGFKKGRAEFEDLIYQNVEQAGSQSSSQGTIVPTGVQVGAGVKAGSVYTISTQGSMTQTSNPLDMAVQGAGYFQVLLPSGETAYTRAGKKLGSLTVPRFDQCSLDPTEHIIACAGGGGLTRLALTARVQRRYQGGPTAS